MSDQNFSQSHVIVIVGGGAAGLSVAAGLLRKSGDIDVAIIEPSSDHYYQPGWTLVGGGAMSAEETHRQEQEYMPDKATWIKDAVVSFQPDANQVTLASGKTVNYKYLVVAAGLQLDWDSVSGLVDTLGFNGVTSNYRFDLAPYTWRLTQDFPVRRRCLHNRPCQSNARVRRKKPCISALIIGEKANSLLMCTFTAREVQCSGCLPMPKR